MYSNGGYMDFQSFWPSQLTSGPHGYPWCLRQGTTAEGSQGRVGRSQPARSQSSGGRRGSRGSSWRQLSSCPVDGRWGMIAIDSGGNTRIPARQRGLIHWQWILSRMMGKDLNQHQPQPVKVNVTHKWLWVNILFPSCSHAYKWPVTSSTWGCEKASIFGVSNDPRRWYCISLIFTGNDHLYYQPLDSLLTFSYQPSYKHYITLLYSRYYCNNFDHHCWLS